MEHLIKGTVIQWEESSGRDKYERVLWLDRENNLSVVFPLTPGVNDSNFPLYLPISDIQDALEMKEAFIRTVDPYFRNISSDSDFLLKYTNERDRGWLIIKDMVVNEPDIYDPDTRGKLLEFTVKKLGTSSKTVYKNLRKYWRYGLTPNAVLPLNENCGGPGKSRTLTEEMVANAIEKGKPIPKRGRKSNLSKENPEMIGINLTDKDKELIKKGINKYYLSRKENSLKSTHQRILEDYYSVIVKGTEVIDPEGRYPSLWQVKTEFYKNSKLKETITARKGSNEYNLNFRPNIGTSDKENLMGPGSVYQIDSTVSDVELVSSLDRSRKIGKATVYFIMDVFSRYIVGAHIGFEKGWDGAHRALFNAFTNTAILRGESPKEEKQKFCSVPKVLYADKGSENISLNSDNLTLFFNVDVAIAPPYRADLKGIIEQEFNQLKESCREIPGFAKNSIKKRADKDPADEAALTISELREFINNIVDDHNNKKFLGNYIRNTEMVKENIERYPIDLWKWGLKKSGALTLYPVDLAIANLLPRGKATITSSGMKFNKKTIRKKNEIKNVQSESLFYTHSRAIKEGWFVESGSMIGKQVDVSYDVYDTNVLFLILDSGRIIEKCQLIPSNQRYVGLHHIEAIDLKRMEKIENSLHSIKRYQSQKELHQKNDKITNTAKTKTKLAIAESGISKTRQKSNKRSNAKEERHHDQSETSIANIINGEQKTGVIKEHVENQIHLVPKSSKYQKILNQIKDMED